MSELMGRVAGALMVLLLGVTAPETGSPLSDPRPPVDPVALGQTGTSICGGPSQTECGFAKATKQGAWELGPDLWRRISRPPHVRRFVLDVSRQLHPVAEARDRSRRVLASGPS